MKWLLFISVAVCLLVPGCDSKNPLSDPTKSKADQRLVGVWRDQKEAGVFYHVGHAGRKFPASMMRVVAIKHEKGNVEPPGEFLMFPTVLGGKTYLNIIVGSDDKLVKTLDEKGWKAADIDSYLLCKYQFDGDKLVLYEMDNDAKKKAITSGKITGIAENGSYRFTDTTENLARFVAEADDGLWSKSKPLHWQRVQLEETKAADKSDGIQFLFPKEVERAMMMDAVQPNHVR